MRQVRPSGALRAHTNPTRIAPNLPPREDPAGGQMMFSNEIRRGRRESKERTRMAQASAGKSSILQQKTHGFVTEPYRTGGFLRMTKQNKKERKKIVANGRMKNTNTRAGNKGIRGTLIRKTNPQQKKKHRKGTRKNLTSHVNHAGPNQRGARAYRGSSDGESGISPGGSPWRRRKIGG